MAFLTSGCGCGVRIRPPGVGGGHGRERGEGEGSIAEIAEAAVQLHGARLGVRVRGPWRAFQHVVDTDLCYDWLVGSVRDSDGTEVSPAGGPSTVAAVAEDGGCGVSAGDEDGGDEGGGARRHGGARC